MWGEIGSGNGPALVLPMAHALSAWAISLSQSLPRPWEVERIVTGYVFFLVTAAYPLVGEALAHPTRRRIYDHLLRVPGDHFRSLTRALRLGLSTAQHHLDVLVSKGLVRRDSRSGRSRYYPSGSRVARGPEDRPHPSSEWDGHPRTRVLEVLLEMGEARPTVIAKALGMSRQLATYHLDRLQALGVARKERGRYRPAPIVSREERPPSGGLPIRTR